jgi:hypothetical protein
MIQETIISTLNSQGEVHLAPMGVHLQNDQFIILPFRPSTTLDNLLNNRTAVINYCDDVRIFAGCLTGHRDWPLSATTKINGLFLNAALAHCEVEVIRVEEDAVRPKLFCKTIYHVQHSPFKGFNRAQFSVLEAAILLSRINHLPKDKISAELNYLSIGFKKTAGPREQEAWQWITHAIQEKWVYKESSG